MKLEVSFDQGRGGWVSGFDSSAEIVITENEDLAGDFAENEAAAIEAELAKWTFPPLVTRHLTDGDRAAGLDDRL